KPCAALVWVDVASRDPNARTDIGRTCWGLKNVYFYAAAVLWCSLFLFLLLSLTHTKTDVFALVSRLARSMLIIKTHTHHVCIRSLSEGRLRLGIENPCLSLARKCRVCLCSHTC
ncbi:unnamed protein product, partial [Ectocarpus sp. 12 AP-2014]